MRWSGGKSRGPIGVDIGSRLIKAVQVSHAGGRPQVTAAVAIPRLKGSGPLERDEVRRLGEVLFRQGFEGRSIVLAAPAESLLVGTLTLPPKQSGAPVDQIARMELARMHKQDPQGFELVHWELPSQSGSSGAGGKAGATSVMAAGCPHAEAAALLDMFESAGMDVAGLDVHWLALARACAPLFAAPDRQAVKGDPIIAVLDLGWRAARIIVLRAGVVLFERLLAEGGLSKLCEQLKAQFQVEDDAAEYLLRDIGCAPPTPATADRRADPDRAEGGDRREGPAIDDAFKEPRRLITAHFDSLKSELQVSLSYAVQQVRGESVSRLLLAGGGGSIPGLCARFAEALAIEVVMADAASLAHCPPGLERLGGSAVLAAALGLARYG